MDEVEGQRSEPQELNSKLDGGQPERGGKQPEPGNQQPMSASKQEIEIRKGSSGWLLLFVFLIAISGLGVSGYLAYVLVYIAEDSSEITAMELLRSEMRELEGSVRLQQSSFNERFATEFARQDSKRLELEKNLVEGMNEAINLAPPGARDWKLAEVEYLLRIANHRLLLEKDVRGTIKMLKSADQILRDLDDFSLHSVRALIAQELQQLSNVRQLDLQGMFLSIEALKSDVDGLPLRFPQYIADKEISDGSLPNSEGHTVLSELLETLSSMFEFREYSDEGFKPMLLPNQASYLEINMRLMLERAQLALLKRDDMLFHKSLASLRLWMLRYLNTGSGKTQSMLSSIDSLSEVELEAVLPEVSSSLNKLLEQSRQISLDPS
ncbi:MAG: uroporphyrinogen-III C-methyltransferase [Pseudomonadales bacterium]|nr:uroporphyrinogen-III C-methyltransferase [Pseudomonadales bacterium]